MKIAKPISLKNYSRQKMRKEVRKLFPNITSNDVIHHLDGNPFNNNLSNLVVMPRKEHSELHQFLLKKDSQEEELSLEDKLKELEDLLIEYNINK